MEPRAFSINVVVSRDLFSCDQSYSLLVTATSIELTASDLRGALYGVRYVITFLCGVGLEEGKSCHSMLFCFLCFLDLVLNGSPNCLGLDAAGFGQVLWGGDEGT